MMENKITELDAIHIIIQWIVNGVQAYIKRDDNSTSLELNLPSRQVGKIKDYLGDYKIDFDMAIKSFIFEHNSQFSVFNIEAWEKSRVVDMEVEGHTYTVYFYDGSPPLIRIRHIRK
jgi:hypothetical protein